MPILSTDGAASAKGFGFGIGSQVNYIEDVFSTYLYTGNGSTQTITNGIDLAGKGGLVWIKDRLAGNGNCLEDTARGFSGINPMIQTNDVGNYARAFPGVTSSGFQLNFTDPSSFQVNTNNGSYVSWSFRKQPKFFDVVTYTGTGSNRTIAHNLASTPGCIFVKRTDTTGDWQVYHSGLTSAAYSIQLNLTNAQASTPTVWNSTAPTSSVFSVGTDATVNASGGTYVAYIFASNAGGFGLTNTDNVITCGSYTGNGSTTGPVINLGYEPQFVLIKNTSGPYNWILFDTMRGMPVNSNDNYLFPNDTAAENSFQLVAPNATGFQLNGTLSITNGSGATYIYIAIRRGPMKVPTDGTKVFKPITYTGNASVRSISAGFPVDFFINQQNLGYAAHINTSRLTNPGMLFTDATTAENTTTYAGYIGFDNMSGINFNTASAFSYFNDNAIPYTNWAFRRAPGFFDEVCYTGNSTAGRAITHNLGAVPELMIVKNRTSAGTDWPVGLPVIGVNNNVFLDYNGGSVNFGATYFYNTNPTSSVFYVGNDFLVNSGSTQNYVAYLFASCPGVSKVGSYTGTGATQTINCGFSGGARFVMVKRTDTTGDWYVWDTARGMVSGTDPSLLLNSTAAEVNANSVYTVTTGFQIVSTAAGINASGGSYIFFAVA